MKKKSAKKIPEEKKRRQSFGEKKNKELFILIDGMHKLNQKMDEFMLSLMEEHIRCGGEIPPGLEKSLNH